MAKILQTITKNTDFETGKVKIELYETSFKTLSKIIGDVPGQTIANAAHGDPVGYQIFRDLNVKQWEMKTKLDNFTTKYNAWINSSKGKASTLLNFGYTFTQTQNYADAIVKDDKIDMLLMEKIVDPEKELYDFTKKSEESMEQNLSVLREWSKGRNYADNVNDARCYASAPNPQTYYYTHSWIVGSKNGFTVSFSSTADENATISIRNIANVMHNDPIGTTRKVTFSFVGQWKRQDKNYTESENYEISITKVTLGATTNDVGKISYTSRTTSGGGGGINLPYTQSRMGVVSGHFDTNNLNLPFLESRKLI